MHTYMHPCLHAYIHVFVTLRTYGGNVREKVRGNVLKGFARKNVGKNVGRNVRENVVVHREYTHIDIYSFAYTCSALYHTVRSNMSDYDALPFFKYPSPYSALAADEALFQAAVSWTWMVSPQDIAVS